MPLVSLVTGVPSSEGAGVVGVRGGGWCGVVMVCWVMLLVVVVAVDSHWIRWQCSSRKVFLPGDWAQAPVAWRRTTKRADRRSSTSPISKVFCRALPVAAKIRTEVTESESCGRAREGETGAARESKRARESARASARER